MDYKQRVIKERDELLEKTDALFLFIHNNPTFSNINDANRSLLREQHGWMSGYLSVLNQRIELFEVK